MKGIILAGGTGTRLSPLTDVTNKHLLPVGRKPMILHLVSKLASAGITQIMIVTGTEHMGDMISLLGSGEKYGCDFTFKVQEKASGIASALKLCKNFTRDDKFVVLLGDNIFEDSLERYVEKYKTSLSPCHLFLKKVPDPHRYGVAVLRNGEIISAIEKPKNQISDMCITGIYMYDASVYEKIDSLKPSNRGEFEITEVNHMYIVEGNATFDILDGWWTDAGTFDSYKNANVLADNV